MFLRTTGSARALIAASGAALLLGLAASTPARALDDGAENIFSSIASLLTAGIGIGGEQSKPPIEYRERAPLVLPPNFDKLPPPGSSAAARNPSWPQDYDAQRHRKQVERDRRPRENYEDIATPGGRKAPAGTPVAARNDARQCNDSDPLERLCNQQQFWSTMKNTRKQEEQKIAVGQEPPRRTLTDPPTGFRRQTTEQKYTFEVENKVDISDVRGQRIEDERRRQAIAEGRNPGP